MFPGASRFLEAGFAAIAVALAVVLVLGVAAASRRLVDPPAVRRRLVQGTALAAVVWMALSWGLAARGVLRHWDAVPPPFGVFLAAVALLGVVLACSGLGQRLAVGLPLAALVGVQVFRLPLELLMHRAAIDGIMPIQMSYSGRNYDILTGIGAGLLGMALLGWRVPRWVVWVWNLTGLALLVNVVAVAVVSTPIFRWFGGERLNIWVTYPPFVWLPAVMVLMAWAGHLVIARALLSTPGLAPSHRRISS